MLLRGSIPSCSDDLVYSHLIFLFLSPLSAVSQKFFTVSCKYFASDVAIDRGIFLSFVFSVAVNHLPLLVIANAF